MILIMALNNYQNWERICQPNIFLEIFVKKKGNNTQELYDRVQENVNKVKEEEGADYVILLTHMGMESNQFTSDELLSKIKNVDAVSDGHIHPIYNTTIKDINNKNIPISQAGTKLLSIEKLIIKKETITSEIIEVVPDPIDTNKATILTRGKKEVWVNKDMNNFINDIFIKYQDKVNILYGRMCI